MGVWEYCGKSESHPRSGLKVLVRRIKSSSCSEKWGWGGGVVGVLRSAANCTRVVG